MQAIECRGEDAKAALVKKGLNVAVTPEAAQKLVCAAAFPIILQTGLVICCWPSALQMACAAVLNVLNLPAMRVCSDESANRPDDDLAFASADVAHVMLQRRLVEAPEEDEDAAPATAANLQTLRLTREEMGFKTVPLVSGLEAATVADLQALPEVRQSGSFSAFTLGSTNPKQQWVVSPRMSPCARESVHMHALSLTTRTVACACCTFSGTLYADML